MSSTFIQRLLPSDARFPRSAREVFESIAGPGWSCPRSGGIVLRPESRSIAERAAQISPRERARLTASRRECALSNANVSLR